MFESRLTQLVLVVVFIAVASSFFYVFYSGVGDSNFECKTSVKAYSQELTLYNIVSPQKVEALATKLIKCPAQDITLDGDVSGMSKVLADEMVRCWDNFGQGKLNLFPSSEGVFCSVCSFVDVKKEIPDFEKYLSSNFHKSDLYISHLTGKSNYETASIASELENQNFEVDKGDYVVLLTYAKGQNTLEFLGRMLNSTSGRTSLIAGTTSVGASVLILAGAASGPIGWALLGIGAVGGAIVSYVSYQYFDQTMPYAAFVSVEPYNSENINNRCTAMPVRL